MKYLTNLFLSLVLVFGVSIHTQAQTRVMTANDSIVQELKDRIKTAKEKTRASRTQWRADEREVNRLTRELERARRQTQKDKLAARRAKAKGKDYTPKVAKVQLDNPKAPKSTTPKATTSKAKSEAKSEAAPRVTQKSYSKS